MGDKQRIEDASAKAAATGIVNDLYSLAKGEVTKLVQRWRIRTRIPVLYQNATSVRHVKTIWQVDREVDILSFYHPSSVLVDEGILQVKTISDLGWDKNLVIEGTVGQGKSIFLRYLTYQELLIGQRIPVFVELRRVARGDSVVSHVLQKLVNWGLEADAALFRFLATEGKIVLLLDAFDELTEGLDKPVVEELEDLSERYPSMQMVVTSRPDNAISRCARFRVFRMAQIEEEELPAFIEKLMEPNESSATLLQMLNDNPSRVKGLLTTPLMVTLLVIRYKAYQEVPANLPEFFEDLFTILLSRHDKTKPGFVRTRRCKLNDRRMQNVFEAFCFEVKRRGNLAFSAKDAHKLASQAIQIEKQDADESNFVEDIVKVTCLVLDEGGVLQFIHKSVQEYYAAAFVSRLTEAAGKKFYEGMRAGAWRHWSAELAFLQSLDAYRFNRWFAVPDLETFFEKVAKRIPRSWNRTPDTVVQRVVNPMLVAFWRGQPEVWDFSVHGWSWQYLGRKRFEAVSAVDQEARGTQVAQQLREYFRREVDEDPDDMEETSYVRIDAVLSSRKWSRRVVQRLNAALKELVLVLESRYEVIKSHEDKEQYVTF